MGKKYIIELLDDCQSEFKGIMVFGVTQEKQISVELIPEESLRPYTEPDLDAIREEEYEKGVQDTKQHWVDAPRSCAYKLGYENGLNDAWDVARKIALDKEDGGLDTVAYCETFGYGKGFGAILKTFTASECIEKIRQYEQGKEKIKVGDEVITDSGKAVVTGVGPVHFEYFNADGSSGYDEVKNVKKTGRTFPEIAEVLRKMKETECSV